MDVGFESSKAGSEDGTEIEFYTKGNGPGLVLIPGTFRSATDYGQLGNFLSDSFRVIIVERRGRGNSGMQGKEYSLRKEVEDVQAVLNLTGARFVFGHSFGGAVALEAALTTTAISKLAIYEPAIISVENALPVHLLPAIDKALEKGNYSDAFIQLMTILTEGEISENKATEMAGTLVNLPVWPQICRLLTTVPAEIRAIVKSGAACQKYQDLHVTTLLMHGSNSQPSAKKDNRLLSETVRHNQSVEIANAAHNGPDIDAPLQVADQLKKWFI